MIVPLTRGYETVVDDADWALVSQYKWSASAGSAKIYAQAYIRGTRRRNSLHRFLMNPAPGETVDHIDGDSLNNRRANLRCCSLSQNKISSRHTSGVSRFKGVRNAKCKMSAANYSKWSATITHEGRRYHLGLFPTEREAASAYDEAALRLFGRFAALNRDLFPDAELAHD